MGNKEGVEIMNNRIYLEKFTSEDFDKYYELVRDERVMAMITERALPLSEAKEKFNLILKNNELKESFGNFKIIEASTNNFIGYGMLRIKEKDSTEAELGYMLLPDFWGKGIGSEVARLLVEKAKGEKQLNKISAMIDPKNNASRKILINNGFISIGLREAYGLPSESFNLKI